MNAALLALWILAAPTSVLEDPDYRFCHEDRYPLLAEERRWCELAGEKNPRCPSLPAACEANVLAEAEEEAAGEGDRIAPPDGDERESKERSALPTTLSPIAMVVLVALLLGPLLYLLAQWWKGRDEEEPIEDLEPAVDDLPKPAPVVMGVTETDVDRLLAMARQAASGGDFGRAIELAYAAALRRLDRGGLIDLHRGKTNGDYLRALRPKPEVRGHLRAVVREVEDVQFGEREATSGRFEAVLGNVLAIVQSVATIALLVLGLGCSALPSGARDDVGGDSSPSGTRALLAHLSDDDIEAGYRLRPLSEVSDEVGTIVILPGSGPRDGDWSPLLEWVDRGGLLVLAGVRPQDHRLDLLPDTTPSDQSRLFYADFFVGTEDLDLLTMRIPPGADLLPYLGDGVARPVLFRYDGAESYEGEVSYHAIGAVRGEGAVMAFASDDLFLNVASAVDDNGPALARLIAPLRPGRVELCTHWTGTGSQNPAESIHEAHLTPFVGQLFLFCLLLLLFRGIAFGPLRDPEVRSRRAFVDHVRALGVQYGRAKASGHAFRLYAGWAVEQLERRVGRGRRRPLDPHVADLASRSGLSEEEVQTTLDAARRADETSPDDALGALRRLATLIHATAPRRQK